MTIKDTSLGLTYLLWSVPQAFTVKLPKRFALWTGTMAENWPFFIFSSGFVSW